MRKTDIAYAAGFFDGEGSVYITLQKDKYVRIEAAVSQKPLAVLYWFEKVFGGKTYTPKGYAGQWKKNGAEAVEFLSLIEPFLIVKQVDYVEAKELWENRHDTDRVRELLDRRKRRKEAPEREGQVLR